MVESPTLGTEQTLDADTLDGELSSFDPRAAPSIVERAGQAKLSERLGLAADPARVDRRRLMREARSLAKLSHPNIVHVYEVGELDERPYLAMELVEGVTLRGWLERQPSRLAVLELFLAIGEGLAAAHAAGVVHRDFKPDNVLVGADGRPRIVDFGLALLDRPAPVEPEVELESPSEPEPEPEPKSESDADAEARGLTRTGALMGTPAYMASEQWLGEGADARSDQYGFCVTLYEALYGRRPFEARTLVGLRERVLGAAPDEVPASERVPAALHAAILRGLERDPDARWPELAPLLDRVRAALGEVQPGVFAGSPARVDRPRDRADVRLRLLGRRRGRQHRGADAREGHVADGGARADPRHARGGPARVGRPPVARVHPARAARGRAVDDPGDPAPGQRPAAAQLGDQRIEPATPAMIAASLANTTTTPHC